MGTCEYIWTESVPKVELPLYRMRRHTESRLTEELSERGAPKSGRKRALQLWLRALIIAEAAEVEVS